MGQGIEFFNRDGVLLADGNNRLGRIVDTFQPNLGSGSKSYPNIAADQLDFIYLQGDGAVLTVTKSGNTIQWALTDSYDARGFTGSRMLIVVTY